MDLLTELNKCRNLKWGDPDKPGDEDSVVYLCALAADEIARLTAELDSTKIKYADCARLLEDAEREIEVWKALQPDQDLKAKLAWAEEDTELLDFAFEDPDAFMRAVEKWHNQLFDFNEDEPPMIHEFLRAAIDDAKEVE